MAKTSKAKIAANARYDDKAYDKFLVRVPKGRKDTVETLAAKRGESVNGMVNSLLRGAVGLTEDEWKRGPEDAP